MKWNIRPIELKLKFDWKISRSTSIEKKNFIIEIEEGDYKAFGEIAPNLHFEETPERVLEEFELFLNEKPEKFESIEELTKFLKSCSYCNALKFGLESAFVDYIARISDLSKHRLLGTNTISQIETSFSVPIMEKDKVESFIATHSLNRFSSLKIKVEKVEDNAFIHEVLKHYQGRIRIDGNECFKSVHEVIEFLKGFDYSRLDFLEQPLPASAHEEALDLKEVAPVLIFADESITNNEITEYYKERFHGVNIKLMKAGSYFQALKQLRRAKEMGLKTMLGCMIESSLGISHAFAIAEGFDYIDLDGSLLHEGDEFGLITEEKGRLFSSELH